MYNIVFVFLIQSGHSGDNIQNARTEGARMEAE